MLTYFLLIYIFYVKSCRKAKMNFCQQRNCFLTAVWCSPTFDLDFPGDRKQVLAGGNLAMILVRIFLLLRGLS